MFLLHNDLNVMFQLRSFYQETVISPGYNETAKTLQSCRIPKVEVHSAHLSHYMKDYLQNVGCGRDSKETQG